MNVRPARWTLAAPLAAVAAAVALVLIPSASAKGQYADTVGDGGTAGDITSLNVTSDPSGQVFFRIDGNGLSSSSTNDTWLLIDTDANPLTGDLDSMGAEYQFGVDNDGYWFERWDGSDWVDTTYATVRVTGGSRGLMISVNRSELGNTSELNFWAEAYDETNKQWDDAPNDGMFNYSLQLQGVHILAALVQTAPVAGPKARRSFSLVPTGLKLPADGSAAPVSPRPDSYTCKATLKGRAVVGTGKGGCTWRLPKNARGKALKVVLTVTYQGTTASFPYVFTVR
jgi:hypothetical protein